MSAAPSFYAMLGGLAGLRSRVEAMERRRVLGLPLMAWETEDALADIDRALAPAEQPAPQRREPVIILLEAAE